MATKSKTYSGVYGRRWAWEGRSVIVVSLSQKFWTSRAEVNDENDLGG